MAKRKTARVGARKKTQTVRVHPLENSWQKTSVLVHRLMIILDEGIVNPSSLPEHWERVFGTKDSAVVSLQKLVAVLAEISEHVERALQQDDVESPYTANVSADDLAMIQRWVEEELGKCDDTI
jgi:hypothetical protein